MRYLKLLKELAVLRRNTKMSRVQMKAFQEKKLRKILAFAYENSAYYRRTFEMAGITEENIGNAPLSDFPVITKQQLLENFDKLITVPDLTQEEIREFDLEKSKNAELFQESYHVVHSSGSTGKPGYFLYDEEAWNHMLSGIIRGALWDMPVFQIIRLLLRGPRIAYIAATDGRYGGAMAVGDGIRGLGARQIQLDINTPLSEWAGQIRTFEPNIVIGYPSAIKILAELKERGEIHVDLVRIITCGEPLGKSLRRYLENIFHAPVINFYGASESLALGVETDAEEGILLFDDLNYIEVQDGTMYLTSLYNFAQPLIRYQITDHLSLKEPGKNSRYPFTKAVGLLGRNEDMLWFDNGAGKREFLHPLAVEGFCVEGLLDYQFQQVSGDTVEMLAETTRNADRGRIRKEILGLMKHILNDKKLSYVQFTIHFVEEILPDPETGKKQLIVNRKERFAV